MLNSCIRFIFNVPIDDHITPYYNQLGWLRLPKKREYILGIVSSRALQTYGLDLQIPIHRTSSYARSFAVFSAKLCQCEGGRNRSALLKQNISIYWWVSRGLDDVRSEADMLCLQFLLFWLIILWCICFFVFLQF